MENILLLGLWHRQCGGGSQQGDCNQVLIFLVKVQVSAIVMGLREAILEENESERDKEQDWRTIAKRGSSWFLFLLSLVGSAYCVVLVVAR